MTMLLHILNFLSLNNISYVYVACLFFDLISMYIWDCFHLLATVNAAVGNTGIQINVSL